MRKFSKEYRVSQDLEKGHLPTVLVGDLSKDTVFARAKHIQSRYSAYRPKLLVISDEGRLCPQRAAMLHADVYLSRDTPREDLIAHIRMLSFVYLVQTRWVHMGLREVLFGSSEVYGPEKSRVSTEEMLGLIAGHALGGRLYISFFKDDFMITVNEKGLQLPLHDSLNLVLMARLNLKEREALWEQLEKGEKITSGEDNEKEHLEDTVFLVKMAHMHLAISLVKTESKTGRLLTEVIKIYAPSALREAMAKLHLLHAGWQDGRREGFASCCDGLLDTLGKMIVREEVPTEMSASLEDLSTVLRYRMDCFDVDKNSEPMVSQAATNIDLRRLFNGLPHRQEGAELLLVPDNLALPYEGILYEAVVEVMRFFDRWALRQDVPLKLHISQGRIGDMRLVTLTDESPHAPFSVRENWLDCFTYDMPENRLFDVLVRLKLIGGSMYTSLQRVPVGNTIVIYHPIEAIFLEELLPYDRIRP